MTNPRIGNENERFGRERRRDNRRREKKSDISGTNLTF